MVWGIVAFALGAIFGYLTPGRQDKSRLFKAGFAWGLLFALVFALVGWLLDANPMGFGLTFVASLVSIVLMLALFLAGVWVGDLLESRGARRA